MTFGGFWAGGAGVCRDSTLTLSNAQQMTPPSSQCAAPSKSKISSWDSRKLMTKDDGERDDTASHAHIEPPDDPALNPQVDVHDPSLL